MDKYDLILGIPRPEVSDRALVSNVPTSVRDWGARDGRQGVYAPEEVLGVTDSNEDVGMRLATGHETKAHCQACGIATTASPNAESRRAVWASTVAVPDGTDQAGNIGPQAAEAAEESAKGVSCVGNIGPQAGNIGPQAGNVRKQLKLLRRTLRAPPVSVNTSRVDNQVPHSESETPPARPVEEQCHVFDGVSGRQVKAGAVHLEALPEMSALLNLEEFSMKDFLAELKAAEMVLPKPETSPEDLNSSSVMDEDVLERQWPLPREQCEVIDAFFAEKAKSGMVRELKSPHSTPTFCS
ncbi:Pol protein [Phytophthora palmivora]|uniref:Pol protein n=1 Tax=Phytophthora palmivora TaxID=4796 RepID=A0A2P4XQC3_9STRA|nr:Pol protein [Phytophthora palmivora]